MYAYIPNVYIYMNASSIHKYNSVKNEQNRNFRIRATHTWAFDVRQDLPKDKGRD